ncbi:dUTP diphosphatase [Staphylococcus chromogenes]|uniref:dUTP diphosphatase n=1 Tax=Staphylococcus chromogenes TaxID=46126 RepID=A0ABD5AU93_STACR|nr:dUTP pyrophosphatase [Staphylococcus chromogenes]MCE5004507.1 dUTP pyrophosphatase [Staphylococcus chromogenes]MCE5093487.1 dUTP pyrophosphatase [Staphylococcus chromogenes]MDQ7175001.1 dUTP pyrophosphatase [Staphylococcus chromogenes]MDU0476338.1 dUTP pyrophosphatase [Staphylococcus chromogenes]PTF96885.1 dUTP pyrophosphatase [Staphylococcus chromogenes]
MDKLQIKLLSENATLPTRNHSTDAGFDIYAAETIILEPQAKSLITTDIAVNIPKGYVGLLTSRSGVSSKTHLVVETGKIDAGFTGNMKINIKNNTQSANCFTSDYVIGVDESQFIPFDNGEYEMGTYQVNKGDKLAQLVIVPIVTPELQQVEEFTSESARGEKGFGSSGF